MSEIITVGDKNLKVVDLNRLNEHLKAFELIGKKSFHVYLINRMTGDTSGMDGKWTVSRGIHGSTFAFRHEYENGYAYEEYDSPKEIPYIIFVDEHLPLATFPDLRRFTTD